MGAIFKVLNSFLGIMAIITCLAAVSIIVYSIVRPDLSRFGIGTGSSVSAEGNETDQEEESGPDNEDGTGDSDLALNEHQHFYRSERYEEPTCLENGRTIFICDCEDYYFEDIPAEGHKLSEWQQTLIPTATLAGERIRTCLVCYITVEREVLPATGVTADPDASPAPSPPPPHVHNYTASVQSEPTCTVAGTRRFSCACGSFYQEMIHASGHMAADWVVAVAATATKAGVRQRICNVCQTLVDTQPIPKLPAPSASPSGSAAPGTSPAPAASPSPSPSVGHHTHTFVYYTSKEPTCTEIGSSTGNCSTANCGAEDIKPVPVNKDNHNFGTGTSKGICTRCGFNSNPSPSASP
jgi:hypothetical protein